MKIFLTVLLLLSSLAVAENTDPGKNTDPSGQTPPYAKALRAATKAVLNGDDFHQRKETTTLTPRPWLKKWLLERANRKKSGPDPKLNFPLLAQILKYAVITALAIALLWLLGHGWQWLSPQIASRHKKNAPGKVREATSLDLRRQSLPEAVSAAAREAWQRGDAVQALSLLYRGTVQSLDNHYHIALPVSATEGECLRLARRSGNAVIAQAFAPIVQAWITLAYAGQAPEDFDTLARLYALHFEARPQISSAENAR